MGQDRDWQSEWDERLDAFAENGPVELVNATCSNCDRHFHDAQGQISAYANLCGWCLYGG